MRKNTNGKMSGYIIAVSDDMVIIKFSENMSSYRNGQHIIVSIPYERKTALGRTVNIAEIVAHGEISDISNNVVTIQSKRANPIISKSALRDGCGRERVMFVETLN